MTKPPLLHADLTQAIIGAFYETYHVLGAWMPEAQYSRALECELRDRGHEVGREYGVETRHKQHFIGQLRLDMVVDHTVAVEIKAGAHLHPAALLQLYGYLKATSIEVGLLLHYGPKPQIKRATFRNGSMRVEEEHDVF